MVLDIFQPRQGDFRQATLFWCGVPVIRLVVEKLVLPRAGRDHWDWTIWPMHGVWRDRDDWYGTEPTAERAELAALDAAVPLLAMLTLDEEDLGAGLPEGWQRGAPVHDHSVLMVQ